MKVSNSNGVNSNSVAKKTKKDIERVSNSNGVNSNQAFNFCKAR